MHILRGLRRIKARGQVSELRRGARIASAQTPREAAELSSLDHAGIQAAWLRVTGLSGGADRRSVTRLLAYAGWHMNRLATCLNAASENDCHRSRAVAEAYRQAMK